MLDGDAARLVVAAAIEQPVAERLLAALQLDDRLLDGVVRVHAVDGHHLRLAEAVRAVLRLPVELRVPVKVVEDDLGRGAGAGEGQDRGAGEGEGAGAGEGASRGGGGRPCRQPSG